MTEKENEKLAAELRSCGEKLIGIAGQLAAGAEAPDGTSEKTAGAAEKTKDAEMAEEVQEKAVTKEDVRAVLAVKLKEGYKEEIRELFEKYGGVPNFLQMYTLFAQVYDGWDTLDKIFSAKIVDENAPDDKEDRNLQPDHEIKFTKVYMSTYGEQKQNGFNIPLKQGDVKVNITTSSSTDSQ